LYELSIINQTLKNCVVSHRKKNFLTFDAVNHELIAALHDVPGITYIEDKRKDQIIFALPLSSIETRIIYPEKTKGYSLEELIQASTKSVEIKNKNCFNLFVAQFSSIGYSGDFERLLR